MAASFDTHQFLTGKRDAVTVVTCAVAILSVNALTLSALVGGSAR